MVGRHQRLNGREFEQIPGDSVGQGSVACCNPWNHRVRHDLATEQQRLGTDTVSRLPLLFFKISHRDFPGVPVVKTSLSNAGGAGSTSGQEAKIPHASRPKKQNIKQKQCCNSEFNKTLNMVHTLKETNSPDSRGRTK